VKGIQKDAIDSGLDSFMQFSLLDFQRAGKKIYQLAK
jgi:hypothetical protein